MNKKVISKFYGKFCNLFCVVEVEKYKFKNNDVKYAYKHFNHLTWNCENILFRSMFDEIFKDELPQCNYYDIIQSKYIQSLQNSGAINFVYFTYDEIEKIINLFSREYYCRNYFKNELNKYDSILNKIKRIFIKNINTFFGKLNNIYFNMRLINEQFIYMLLEMQNSYLDLTKNKIYNNNVEVKHNGIFYLRNYRKIKFIFYNTKV